MRRASDCRPSTGSASLARALFPPLSRTRRHSGRGAILPPGSGSYRDKIQLRANRSLDRSRSKVIATCGEFAKRPRPSIGKPASCHARKERVLLIGTDQRITSGPAAITAALKGRIHGCTRTFREKVRFFSLAPRTPSIHGTHATHERLGMVCSSRGSAQYSVRPAESWLECVLFRTWRSIV